MIKRPPDFVIGDNYLRRWWIIPRNRWFNVYLHEFRRSDPAEACHDHPWWNVSIVLRGWYIEHMPKRSKVRSAGAIVFRRATALHRVIVPQGGRVWTLFITGRKRREWGFQCPNGWRPWYQFVDPDRPGQVGAGCGEK